MNWEWTLEEITLQPNGSKVWRLRVKACNEESAQVKGRLVENPWRADNSEKVLVDRDAQGNPVPGSDKTRAKAAGVDMTLAPASQPGACATAEWTYDVKPRMAYTDFYEYEPDGTTLKEDWMWGTVEALTPVQAGGGGAGRRLALVVPTPFQMSLDDVHDGPVVVVAEPIEVPPGFEIEAAVPPFGEPFELQHADRGSSAAITLGQLEALEPDARGTLRIRQDIVAPDHLTEWPARVVSVDIVNDVSPPVLEIQEVNGDNERLDVLVAATDECSGIDAIELVVSFEDESVGVFHPVWSESDGPSRLCRFQARAGQAAVVRAFDKVGNQSTLDLGAAL